MNRQAEIYIRQMKYDDARNKLLREIEHLFFEGTEDVEVIHGIGNYILREMAIKELEKLDYVTIDLKIFNPNPGSLKVRLLTPEKSILDSYRA